jgi:hypothetical protein
MSETNDGKTNLPSLTLASLTSINANFNTIIDCQEAYIDLIHSYKVTGLLPPTDPSDAANKQYVDNAVGSAAGGSDTNIQFNANGIFGGTSQLSWTTATSTLTVLGKVTGLTAPTGPLDATNKQYVDSMTGPGGPNKAVQFNGNGTFSSSANFLWTTATNTLTVNGTITDGVATLTGGDLFVSDIDATGLVEFTNTTQSTTPNNGCLTVKGGVGVSKDVHVAGNAYANKFLATSDATLKENIQPLTDCLSKIRAIETYKYFLKKNGYNEAQEFNEDEVHEKYLTEDYGVIAQQLEKIGLSDVVDNTGKYKSVNYISILVMLLNAVKEIDKNVSRKNFSKIMTQTKGLEQEIQNIIDSLKASSVEKLKEEIREISTKITKEHMDKRIEECMNILDVKSDKMNMTLNFINEAINEKIKNNYIKHNDNMKNNMTIFNKETEELYNNVENTKDELNCLRNNISELEKSIKCLEDVIIKSEDRLLSMEKDKTLITKYVTTVIPENISLLHKNYERDITRMKNTFIDIINDIEKKCDLHINNIPNEVENKLVDIKNDYEKAILFKNQIEKKSKLKRMMSPRKWN